jgi:hypothetical protein
MSYLFGWLDEEGIVHGNIVIYLRESKKQRMPVKDVSVAKLNLHSIYSSIIFGEILLDQLALRQRLGFVLADQQSILTIEIVSTLRILIWRIFDDVGVSASHRFDP